MTIRFDRMPHACAARVTAAVEAYSAKNGLAHGSLDATAYVCAGHTDTARQMWRDQGLTPYTAQAAPSSSMRCGEISDFRH
ncbi:hypothetical protein [Streptomyces sp. NPDC048659]|uniref:hypothetical protein n=1 Tax=Streptomyces sp. NPDC048659 TaxID=3155489 RepID=UPI00343578EE